jgi:hypothetical protein
MLTAALATAGATVMHAHASNGMTAARALAAFRERRSAAGRSTRGRLWGFIPGSFSRGLLFTCAGFIGDTNSRIGIHLHGGHLPAALLSGDVQFVAERVLSAASVLRLYHREHRATPR